jgi:phosphate starvation-inducible PhoH-like protein
MEKKVITVENTDLILRVLGKEDENLKFLRTKFDGLKLTSRGNEIFIEGPNENLVNSVYQLFMQLIKLASLGHLLKPSDIMGMIKPIKNGKDIVAMFQQAIYISDRGKPIFPKSLTQKDYIEAIRNYDIVFGIGPAGTGKTYLAVAVGLAFLQENSITRLIISRPVVEAGEKLGFLPGDIQQKVNPYLQPLYDALYDIVGYTKAIKLQQEGRIEILPLAYMRGRTLNNAFIILDEAQNTTKDQMKMFLSRLGFDSKAVITGDITQIDLPKNKTSGLVHAANILSRIKDIKFIYFNKSDIIRHKLVSEILKAYEETEE